MGTHVCRVSVHVGGVQADVALPADLPVVEVIPSLYDVMVATGGPLAECLEREPPTYVYCPGQPPLDQAMTLSENGLRDGSLLVLASATAEPAPVRVVHAAEAVERAAHPPQPSSSPARSRLAALLVVTAMAAVTGFVAVPGEFGIPSLLLSSTAAAATAAISARVIVYGRTALMALSCLCALVAATTLGATLFDIPAPAAGLVLIVVSIVVLTIPGRLSMTVSGLSTHIDDDLDPDSAGLATDVWVRAQRAQRMLSALVVGASFAAVLGVAAVTLETSNRDWPSFAIAGCTAALLVLRSSAYPASILRTTLAGCGMACTAMLFVGLRSHHPGLTPWIAIAAAALSAGSLWLGFGSTSVADSMPVRRCLDVLDCVALACVIPLACWSSGVYGAVRGMIL
ncbi:N/A [soil metagenome]